MHEIEQTLVRELGLNVGSIGHAVVERAVLKRMIKCHIPEMRRYKMHLLHNPAELQALIEDLVVSETWFFRNHEALVRMTELLTTEWPAMTHEHVRRVLSVPCATGEEPYSIAIALAESGLRHEEVRIDAMDISHHALAQATRGVYGQNSFRGEASRQCERYVRPVRGGVEILPELRRWVHFAQGNLVSPSFQPPSRVYDVIFCRNVLIYLDRAAQERVLETLHRFLTPNGYLFLGPAEMTLAVECGFRVREPATAFVCQKTGRETVLPSAERSLPVRPVMKISLAPHYTKGDHALHSKELQGSVLPPRPHLAPRIVKADRTPAAEAGPARSPQGVGDLDSIRRLADAGRVTEAADSIAAYLREHGPSAEAFYLLGLLCDARGATEEAVPYYRKALFLDPNHVEAAALLAIHAQRSGDSAGAERLRARSQRIERRRKL